MNKVLLVDDDIELLGMLKDYLVQDGFDVVARHDGGAVAAEALSGQYAIVVLDVMMPRTNGIDILRKIRCQSNMPILMLTAKGDDADRIVGLELGADDYVSKPCTSRELAARIRAILRRTQFMACGDQTHQKTTPIVVGPLAMWPTQRRAEWAGALLNLTSTEFNLLEVLARNAGQPVSKGLLSQRGLGRALALYDRNIDVHFSSLRQKLGTLTDGRSCIQTVYRQGYQLLQE